MTSQQIRQQFLDFFRAKQHDLVPSSPVVPHDDPTLMFANAGMNQFKPIFLGTVDRNSAFGRLKRAANTQKCIRAGGKHNDLDDVGQDTYHHTFFEMLGNWSFGDYFKKEAIEWAWELLTEVWKIDKTRLHATYFGGLRAVSASERSEAMANSESGIANSDEVLGTGGGEQRSSLLQGEGTVSDRQPHIEDRQSDLWELEPDYESRDLWASVTDIDPSHIHPGSMKDNFWEMGDTGPCGPCSEIHIDLTPDKSGGHLVNAGDARVMELWNLVFIQFNRAPDGKLSPLPAKHVDTGMGFERLCAVLQGMAEPQASACANSQDSESRTEVRADSHRSSVPKESERSRVLKHAAQNYRFSNYDTDVFTPIFQAIQKRTGATKYRSTLPNEPRTSVRADSQGSLTPNESDRPRDLKIAAREDVRAASASDRSNQTEISDLKSQIMIDVSYRVIADHLRCLTFALTDGAAPSNEGRGYVLRRILRRAVRYGRQYMNMHEPFLCDLVKPLVDHMGDVFPELRTGPNPKRPIDNVKHVADILRDEEASFLKTLDRGIKLFNEAAEQARRHHHGKISGEDAFRLHDTYGFPIDLTELMAEEQGLTIDIGEYERLMEEAREKARASGVTEITEFLQESKLSVGVSATLFVGYKELSDEDVLWSAFKGDNLTPTLTLTDGERGALILGKTPFYAEQGGQVGDKGTIRDVENTWEFQVEETKKVGKIFVHLGKCIRGEVRPRTKAAVAARAPGSPKLPSLPKSRVSGEIVAEVSSEHRLPTMQNHTATHLLNWALREVLCPPEEREHPHVQQKGSLVDPEKTRFDFSHNHPLSEEELQKIESLVNKRIKDELPVYTNNNIEVDQTKAREITGLRAVFGEKYPDKVRVVSIGVPVGDEDLHMLSHGEPRASARADDQTNETSTNRVTPRGLKSAARVDVPDSSTPGANRSAQNTSVRPGVGPGVTLLNNPNNPEWLNYSIEFCGGTHVGNTREIEAFVLTEESGVAKGIRRVVGVSGQRARDARAAGQSLLDEVNALAGKPPVAPMKGESKDSLCSGGAGGKDRAHGSQSSGTPADLAARVAAFQEKTSKCETPIPISVRHAIRERLTELQKIVKEQEKASVAESGEAVMDRVAQLLEQAKTPRTPVRTDSDNSEPRTSVRADSPDATMPQDSAHPRGLKLAARSDGGSTSNEGSVCLTIGDVVVVVGEVPPAKPDALRGAIDWVRNKTKASAVLLACVDEGKVTLMAGMSKSVVERGVKAGDLIREIAPLVGGKGGGRPDMAQGGGSDPGGLEQAMERAGAWMAEKLT